MTYLEPPTDSADARDRRELDVMDDKNQHNCNHGWLGVDKEERPIACPRCRPHLVRVACWLCSATAPACDMKRDQRRGRCCDHCDHRPARHPARPSEAP